LKTLRRFKVAVGRKSGLSLAQCKMAARDMYDWWLANNKPTYSILAKEFNVSTVTAFNRIQSQIKSADDKVRELHDKLCDGCRKLVG
jgi:hypothetical protein